MKKLLFFLIFIASTINSYSQPVINEIFASNVNAYFDRTKGNFAGYIEFYNKGSQNVKLGGYYLSNKADNPSLWKFPGNIDISAKGYYIVYCDELNEGNHANFKLDADGGKIILYNQSLQIVDSLTYGKQFTDIPFGQKPDGSGKWTRLETPSPRGSNNSVKSGVQICPKPTITPDAGFYQSNVEVSITSNLANAEIRYTTDGSEPTKKSSLYSVPFTISLSGVVKAKNFHSEYLPGSTSCSSYLIKEHRTNLPIVSLSVNPEYLTNDSFGIYVVGVNGIDGYCYGKTNWNRDWEKPAVFEYFDPTGTLQMSQSVDIKVAGKCSRTNAQKSFGILPSSRYGSGRFEYPFFKSKPFKNYASLMLRNSGNDFNRTMFRDALLQELCINQMDVDYQAYQPTEVFVNGKYWGLMNLREKADKNYLRVNQSLPLDSVTMLEMEAESIIGSGALYKAFIDSLSVVDITSDEGYKFLDRNIDINEYLNYLAVQIYIANEDWPGNNVKYWKANKPGAKWRWILTDLDYSFGIYDSSIPQDSSLYFVTEEDGPDWPNPAWSTLLIRKVFENPVTRDLFIQKMQTVINTIFAEDRVNAKIDSIKNMIAAEMVYHWQKYGSNATEWNRNIEGLRNFNKVRSKFMSWHLKDFFKLSDTYTEMTFKDIDRSKGEYFFNGIQVLDTLPKEFISEIAVDIEAAPMPGYEFDGWKVQKYNVERVELISKGSDWKYFDQGADKISGNWRIKDFDDASWTEAPAELGYGDGDEATTIGYGGNANNKAITTAFRKTLAISDVQNVYKLTGRILYDDGAVVYLNGTEVFRINMPDGIITASTLATVFHDDDDLFQSFDIPVHLLQEGENIIAVEIHQCDAYSSDISFDFDLSLSKREYTGTTTYSTAKINDVFTESAEFTALFKETSPVSTLLINEVAASNKTFPDNRGECEDWIEIYNAGETSIDLSRLFIEYEGNSTVRGKVYNTGSYSIPPKGYALLWADDEIEEGPVHLPFKMQGEGETIKLIQEVGEEPVILDSYTVEEKYSNATIGRYPDGNANWIKMGYTPGKANIDYLTDVPSLENTDEDFVVYPNPAGNFFNVFVKNADNSETQLTLMTNDGRILKTFMITKSDKFDLSDVGSGVYILRIAKKAAVTSKKIIVIK